MRIIARHHFHFKFKWFFEWLKINKKDNIQKWVNDFFCSYFYTSEVLLFASARSAFIFLLKNLKLPEGSKVILPKHRFYIYEKILPFFGLKPVFAPVDNNLLLDVEKINEFIDKDTKMIIALHLFSRSCNIEKLKQICKNNNIILVEDVAHAFGSTYNLRPLGSFGDFSLLSFGTGKHLVAFGGGALVINNKSFKHNYSTLPDAKNAYKDFLKGLIEFIFSGFPFYHFLVFPVFFLFSFINRDVLEKIFFENEEIFILPEVKKLDKFRCFLLKKRIEFYKIDKEKRIKILEKLESIFKKYGIHTILDKKLKSYPLFYQCFMSKNKSNLLLRHGIDNRYDYCYGFNPYKNKISIYLPIHYGINKKDLKYYIKTIEKIM